jgi:hypothetical protein
MFEMTQTGMKIDPITYQQMFKSSVREQMQLCEEIVEFMRCALWTDQPVIKIVMPEITFSGEWPIEDED